MAVARRSRKQPRVTVERLVDEVEAWQPKKWYPLANFSIPGKGPGAFCKDVLGRTDPEGIYVIRARDKAAFKRRTGIELKKQMFYVGRAEKIAQRLNRHLQVVNHNSASLVYKITALSLGVMDNPRAENMGDERANGFKDVFKRNQAYLRDECEMAYYPCPNNEEQALLEILFSLRFNTQFNDWKTH